MTRRKPAPQVHALQHSVAERIVHAVHEQAQARWLEQPQQVGAPQCFLAASIEARRLTTDIDRVTCPRCLEALAEYTLQALVPKEGP